MREPLADDLEHGVCKEVLAAAVKLHALLEQRVGVAVDLLDNEN